MTQGLPPKGSHGHTAADGDHEFTADEVEALVREYDSESNFRNLVGPTAMLVTIASVLLSLFHLYTAGFGLLNEVMHRTIHLAFVMGLIFLVFPRKRAAPTARLWIESGLFATFYLYILYGLATSLSASTTKTVFIAVMLVLIALNPGITLWGLTEIKMEILAQVAPLLPLSLIHI